MKHDFPNLCRPLRVGNLVFRNRMTSAPMGATDILADGTPGLRTLGFYEARAKGGAASVTVSELVVHPETDGSQMLRLSLETPGQLGAFAYVADAIKRHGAIASIELSHSGQYAGTYMVDKKRKADLCQYGPSDGVRPDGMRVRALAKGQIDDIVAAYAEAAMLAKRAGFQMCMVHGGHGWLINQFLSPYFNKRDDEYGGSLENRTRFAREILQAIKDACGNDFPIEFRMSGSELFDGGYDIDEGCKIAKSVEGLVDLFHISAGSYQFGFSITHPSMFRDHGCNVYLAEAVKRCVDKPVVAIGGLSDAAQMEEIVASGKADAVSMARGLLADPEIPDKIMANRSDEIVKCLRCFVCMAERPVTQTRRCAVNVHIGREFEGLDIVPAASPKKVLVAGGGIAGLKAAHTAALRGHDVTLCEAGDRLGGILNSEEHVDFKHEMYELGQTYALLCKRAGVDIRLNTKVDSDLVDSFGADALIVAVGSAPIPVPFPTDNAWVMTVNDLGLDGTEPGHKIAVVGGGLSGCECAVNLAMRGHNVHLFEMRNELAADANIRHRPILLSEIERLGVDVHTGAKVERATSEGIYFEDAQGSEEFIACEGIVSAIGQRSRAEEIEKLRAAAPFTRIIGDAVRPANITLAMYEAYHAALDI